MLLQFTFFFILLTLLFFLSQKISSYVYALIYLVSKNSKLSVGTLLFLLLPGTIIHELGHLFIATLLRVPTSSLSIFPSIEEDGKVQAGKLNLGKTDPFRHTIIGLSPLFLGLTLIYIIGKIFLYNLDRFQYDPASVLSLSVICYLLSVSSTTMFSSKKDLAGAIIAVPIILLIVSSLYLIGIRISLEKSLLEIISLYLSDLNFYLLITMGINIGVFSFFAANLYIWQKILKRKITFGKKNS